jgi:4-amino-4-deoxy-L-arabinose transferase-like glycosyltransferase
VTKLQHAARVGLLMAGAAALLGWVVRHTETSFADGLRYIHRAQAIQSAGLRGGLIHGIDHPLHPLGIVLAHGTLGGDGPASWQRAALLLCFLSAVLLVIPTYLLTLELFGGRAAWMGSLLVIINPIIGYIVTNVLSECTFLLWWMFGVWAAVRFLREGRFLWLPLATGFACLAYLTRPEGMLLPAALAATLLLLPLVRATRINWPRWWLAMSFLVGGLVVVAGPYIALKGGIGTKPGIAKVLGLAAPSDALGLERERPLPPGQTEFETYKLATIRMLKVFRAAVTPPLFPFALLGVGLAARSRSHIRAHLFLAIMLAASAAALVRLHATAGYCTVRHGLLPGIVLTLAAAHGMTWMMDKVSIHGRWLALAQERLRPGPAVWAVVMAACIVIPNVRSLGPLNRGPFSVYQQTGEWLARNTVNQDQVLDLTDWSLYFSGRPGYAFADIYQAPVDHATRWIVARKPHVEGHWAYSRIVRKLVDGRPPVAFVPPVATPHQVQVRIYDRLAPAARTVASPSPVDETSRRR